MAWQLRARAPLRLSGHTVLRTRRAHCLEPSGSRLHADAGIAVTADIACYCSLPTTNSRPGRRVHCSDALCLTRLDASAPLSPAAGLVAPWIASLEGSGDLERAPIALYSALELAATRRLNTKLLYQRARSACPPAWTPRRKPDGQVQRRNAIMFRHIHTHTHTHARTHTHIHCRVPPLFAPLLAVHPAAGDRPALKTIASEGASTGVSCRRTTSSHQPGQFVQSVV